MTSHDRIRSRAAAHGLPCPCSSRRTAQGRSAPVQGMAAPDRALPGRGGRDALVRGALCATRWKVLERWGTQPVRAERWARRRYPRTFHRISPMQAQDIDSLSTGHDLRRKEGARTLPQRCRPAFSLEIIPDRAVEYPFYRRARPVQPVASALGPALLGGGHAHTINRIATGCSPGAHRISTAYPQTAGEQPARPSALPYFPMQKLEKIRPSRSSVVTSPVISPRACWAPRSSSATSSPARRSS